MRAFAAFLFISASFGACGGGGGSGSGGDGGSGSGGVGAGMGGAGGGGAAGPGGSGATPGSGGAGGGARADAAANGGSGMADARAGGSDAPGSAGMGGSGPGTGGGSGTQDALPPPQMLPPGTWKNVTPATRAGPAGGMIDSNISYSGAQDVVVDPAKPSDLYAFINYMGLFKSTDFGQTWTKVNTGMNGAVIDTGKTWTLGIDPNKRRNPATPPTLYTTNWGGTGKQGLWKSTNGGVDWTRCPNVPITSQDVYSIDLDPYDSQHLIIGYHEEKGLSESTDACASWKNITAAPASEISMYPFFVDTGDPATTRQTWLAMGQAIGGKHFYRTADGGTTFTVVDSLGHAHGSSQIFQAGGGVIYAPGLSGSKGSGVYRSADYGVTWTLVNGGIRQNAVYGTPNYIYADYGWSTTGTENQTLQRTARNVGTQWTQYTPTPAGFVNGAKRAAVTFDGTRWIIVSGNRQAGIWRYIE